MENNKLNSTDKNITDETATICNKKPLSDSKVDLFVNDSNKESPVCIKSTTETEENKRNSTNVNAPYEALEVIQNLENNSRSLGMSNYVYLIIYNLILWSFGISLILYLTIILYSDDNGKMSKEMKNDIGISEFGFSALQYFQCFSNLLYAYVTMYSMGKISDIIYDRGNTGVFIAIVFILLCLSLVCISYCAGIFLTIFLSYEGIFYFIIVMSIIIQILSSICVYSYIYISQKAPGSRYRALYVAKSYFKRIFCAIYHLNTIVCIVLYIIIAVNRSNWVNSFHSKITAKVVANATNSSALSL
ncbi:hypothetical protein NEPAR04_2440 [Nematocida parisii]|nr:hypothetical protein NEPAR04_2440 [Nematocida parisii]